MCFVGGFECVNKNSFFFGIYIGDFIGIRCYVKWIVFSKKIFNDIFIGVYF